MIVRRDQAPLDQDTAELTERLLYSDAGGLTQFGAYVETLQPGARSSDRHWHEEEDEFLYVLSGEATAIEEDGAHLLYPGDAGCWPAGMANAHQVVNRSGATCTYLIFAPGWHATSSITPTWARPCTTRTGPGGCIAPKTDP